MVFQSFQQTWKPLQAKPAAVHSTEPTLQPKHFLAVPSSAAASDTLVVPVLTPVVKETAGLAAQPSVRPEAGEAQCSCPSRPWFASPWLSLGLSIGLVVMMMWAVSTRIENAWLMKQHTQLMFNLIETLRL